MCKFLSLTLIDCYFLAFIITASTPTTLSISLPNHTHRPTHTGPLLYHYADTPGERSIELSWADLRKIATQHIGFEIIVRNSVYRLLKVFQIMSYSGTLKLTCTLLGPCTMSFVYTCGLDLYISASISAFVRRCLYFWESTFRGSTLDF